MYACTTSHLHRMFMYVLCVAMTVGGTGYKTGYSDSYFHCGLKGKSPTLPIHLGNILFLNLETECRLFLTSPSFHCLFTPNLLLPIFTASPFFPLSNSLITPVICAFSPNQILIEKRCSCQH